MSAKNKAIVQAINEAFMQNNISGFLNHCTDDIVWNMIGQPLLNGKEAIAAFMQDGGNSEPPVLELDSIIAEGDKVASNGKMSMKKSDGSPYHGAFCDIYHFSGDKVVQLDSYIVDL